MHQQEELVGAMLLCSSRTNRSSYVFCQGLDSILKFVVPLAFRSSYDVVQNEGDPGRMKILLES